MRIGLIGAGNMARAMARGWGRPLLVADPIAERARALADELGGETRATNAEVARDADLVVLCHKPAQLREVAGQIAGQVTSVASILAGVPIDDLRAAYPQKPVHRFLPSTPVEVRQGVVLHATSGADGEAEVAALFAELGVLVTLDEALVDVGMALCSNAPAFWALVAEAQVDAGVRRGLPAERASELVAQTMAGSAALLARRAHDTLAMRRGVTSPGGSTARGLAALERGGVRAAFDDAIDAVLA